MTRIPFCIFFFTQKTAYEILRSDWSSDVSSSDLPKTEASQKDVPLDVQLAESLSLWKQRSPYTAPGDWVFASPHKKGRQPYWPGTLWRYYGKPAVNHARVNKHVSYHTFRHTFGTLLNANGENAKVVQELLRHASMKVTTDIYMQAVSPQKREAQSKLVRMVLKKTASQSQLDQIGP